MEILKKEISNSAQELNIPVKSLSTDITQVLGEKIIKLFCINSRYQYPLWENLKDKDSIYDVNGWRIIDTFKNEGEIVLFPEPTNNKFYFFVFDNLVNVKKVIENSFGFVFYLTNHNSSFLICFNDHDYLIASGDAIEWLRHIKQKSHK